MDRHRHFLARAAAEQLNLSHVRPEYYAWRSDAGPDGLDYFVIEPGPILDQAMYARHRAL